MSERQYEATTTDISIVDGVEVDITVREAGDGNGEVDKVLLDLKERLGILGYAFETETPPNEIEEVPDRFTAPMSVAWDRVFDTEADR
jgi:hypothetical protein